MKKGYTKDDVVKRLKSLQGGQTQSQFAAKMDVTQQYLNDVLLGNRKPGKKILGYLGFEAGYIKSENAT